MNALRELIFFVALERSPRSLPPWPSLVVSASRRTWARSNCRCDHAESPPTLTYFDLLRRDALLLFKFKKNLKKYLLNKSQRQYLSREVRAYSHAMLTGSAQGGSPAFFAAAQGVLAAAIKVPGMIFLTMHLFVL